MQSMSNKQKRLKDRRQFLNTNLKTTALLPFLSTPLLSLGANAFMTNQEKVKPLKILILGGTSFLGPHQIAYALERGHVITTFTRGKTKPTIHKKLFKEVEEYIGIVRVNNEHAIANGLSFRPLAETMADLHQWWHSDAVSKERKEKFLGNKNSLLKRAPGIIEAWKKRAGQ